MGRDKIELLVGSFVIIAVFSFAFLAFQVSGLTAVWNSKKAYVINAAFDNIGSLKVRAPVTLGGVKIGEVTLITLNQKTFQAMVNMRLFADFDQIPDDTSASIYTAGLVGANYIGLVPGYAETFLRNGSMIRSTHSALVLENLISQYLFGLKKGN